MVGREDAFFCVITRGSVLACYESLCKYVTKVTQVHMCETQRETHTELKRVKFSSGISM